MRPTRLLSSLLAVTASIAVAACGSSTSSSSTVVGHDRHRGELHARASSRS